MPSLPDIKASNALLTETTLPRVVVFTGGTAGIGQATLKLLVSKNAPMRVYVIGRNGPRHEAFLEELRASNASADIIWLEGQLSLLADVKRLCDGIIAREQSIDVLFMAAGALPFAGRRETSEGLELTTVLSYYARMQMTILLQALLARSTWVSGPRVVNILAAGLESGPKGLYLDDPGLIKPGHFNLRVVTRVGATYTTLILNRFAMNQKSSNVIYIHNHPGVVATDILQTSWSTAPDASVSQRLGRWVMSSVTKPLVRAFALSPEDAGERCLFLMTSAAYGNGKGQMPTREKVVEEAANVDGGKGHEALWAVGARFKCLKLEGVRRGLGEVGAEDVVWEHTVEVLQPYL